MRRLSTADKIICNAAALAKEMGISDRELARSALHLAIGVAEQHGDPDGYLAALVSLTTKGKGNGR
jgi:hypothetical protein